MSQQTKNTSQTKSMAFWLGALVVLALVLRIAFNLGVAQDPTTDDYLYSGNDPWYHDRATNHILETGESLELDQVTTYPEGRFNPNPPLFDWTASLFAKGADAAGVADPVGLTLNMAVAVWGALTVIPVFLLADRLFGRNAAIASGFLMAVSAPHIQRSIFGFADHDATTMFFITLAFYFVIRALDAIKQGTYIHSFGSIGSGVQKALSENKVALSFAILAGTVLSAAALTWKGYPYAIGVLGIALSFQLLVDNIRHRDGTVATLVYLIVAALPMVLSAPYYLDAGSLAGSTIMPNLYGLIAMVAVALVLLPTRELPSLTVVLPAVILTGVIGLVLALVVFPNVGALLFTGLGYFQTSKLYSTIAEAQRTQLGFVAANFGFFTFVLAFWAFGRTIRNGAKGHKASLFMAAWAAVAMFMAFAASRFLMNAAPVFAILMGAAIAWIIGMGRFETLRRGMRQRHGVSPVKAFFGSLNTRAVVTGLVVGFLFILPNAYIGVDAAMSREFERDNGLSAEHWGAFGVDIGVKGNGWLELLQHLATLDNDQSIEDRPAFMAWWDYGHWATAIGDHPTVADPFQGHYEIAGRFLASETEEEAINWLTVLLLDGAKKTGGFPETTLAENGIDAAAYMGSYEDRYAAITAAPDAVALYEDVSAATGKRVEYVGVDSRMFPLSAQNTGIFYAPVYLANKNPDEFLRTTYVGTGLTLTLEQYAFDEDGNSYRLDVPRFLDAQGNEWIVAGGQAFRAGTSLNANSQGVPVQPQFVPTEKFINSMYRQAFGGITPDAIPGDGLTNFRLEHQVLGGGGSFRQTALLVYTPGATVTGTVLDDAGVPQAGVDVVVVDEFGATHGVGVTDANGAYSLQAVFGDLDLEVREAGETLHSVPLSISKDAADARASFTQDIELTRGSLNGVVFRDLNEDGLFNEGDAAVSGAIVTVDGRTVVTDGSGAYQFNLLAPGALEVTVTADHLDNATVATTLTAGAEAMQDILMVEAAVPVEIKLLDDGAGVATTLVEISGDATQNIQTDADGLAMTDLRPGTYTITIDSTTVDANGVEKSYFTESLLVVNFGSEKSTLTLNL